jgi:hypothetical protein
MLTQQPQRLSGLGQNPDRFGAADIDGIVIAVPGEDVGDPVDGGFEPDRIPSRSPGNDQLQAMLTAAAQPHKPFLRSSSGLLFGTVGVGLTPPPAGFAVVPGHRTQRGCDPGIHRGGLLGGDGQHQIDPDNTCRPRQRLDAQRV